MTSPSQAHAYRNALLYQNSAALQSAAARRCMDLYGEVATHEEQAAALNGFEFYANEAAFDSRTARDCLFRLIDGGRA